MKNSILRALRSVLAMAAGAGVSALLANPKFIWLAPALQGIGKAMRDKWPGAAPYVPF